MLAAQARLRSSADFAATVRRGVRASGATVVVHARVAKTVSTKTAEDISRPPANTQVGFVVSKRVGNAVVRNRVKRRLRHLCRQLLAAEAAGSTDGFRGRRQIVVRALPAAASEPEKVEAELSRVWAKATKKLAAWQL